MQRFDLKSKITPMILALAAICFVALSCEQEPQTPVPPPEQKAAQTQPDKDSRPAEKPQPETAGQRVTAPAPPATEVQALADPSVLEKKIARVYESSARSVLNVTSRIVTTNIFNMSIPQQGTGSGFVWDDRGHVVTNYHLVRNAEKVLVSAGEEQTLPAEIIGTDPSTDLAVLKVDDGLPPPLELGDSEELQVGQFVVALGNPFGLKRSLTFGVVSALGRVIRNPKGGFISEAIQTDTPINAGNSGGPLLDLNGSVIGINSMIVSPSGANAGVGFAVPSETVRRVIPALIENGRYPHPWLGIQTIELNRGWVKLMEKSGLEMPVDEGLLVVATYSGSPAAESEIQGGNRYLRLGNIQIPVGGDIIVRIEDQAINNRKELIAYLENYVNIGQTVTLTYYRGDDKRTARLTVEDRPPLKAES